MPRSEKQVTMETRATANKIMQYFGFSAEWYQYTSLTVTDSWMIHMYQHIVDIIMEVDIPQELIDKLQKKANEDFVRERDEYLRQLEEKERYQK